MKNKGNITGDGEFVRDVFNAGKSIKVKVKFALEQAMKVQRESRGVALLFL
jgi:hypothetical protein